MARRRCGGNAARVFGLLGCIGFHQGMRKGLLEQRFGLAALSLVFSLLMSFIELKPSADAPQWICDPSWGNKAIGLFFEHPEYATFSEDLFFRASYSLRVYPKDHCPVLNPAPDSPLHPCGQEQTSEISPVGWAEARGTNKSDGLIIMLGTKTAPNLQGLRMVRQVAGARRCLSSEEQSPHLLVVYKRQEGGQSADDRERVRG